MGAGDIVIADDVMRGMLPQEARDLAQKSASRGIPTFPIGLSWNHGKRAVDKTPLSSSIANNGFHDAATDPQRVEEMFLKAKLGPRQEWGVGVRPGPAGYIVLDIDVKNNGTGPEDLDRLTEELGPLPEAMKVETASGGFHLWLKRPQKPDHIGNVKIADGIDIRCDAGYVVAPTTRSPWGSWTPDAGTPRLDDVGQLPVAWADRLYARREDGTRDPIPETLTAGNRYPSLLRLAGAMRRQGATGEEILAALRVMNQRRCVPPHEDVVLEKLAEDIFDRYPAEPDPIEQIGPPAEPADPTSLDQCVATFRKWMHLPDPGPVYVSLATVLANRGEGDPVWTLLVGGPSSGKTEPVLTLREEPDCHLSGPITEAALLSGTPKRDAKGAKGGLLREIGDFGILLVKDFTSVLSMYRDTRAVLLAALREIYDGTWTRHVGTDGGRTLHWDGKLGLLGCVTGAIDAAHGVMGSMGDRFVLYRMPDAEEDEQSRSALGRSDGRQMRTELAAAMRGALAAAADQPTRKLTPVETDFLVALSQLVARSRSTVDRDGYSREINLVYAPEGPARIALVLKEMLLALARLGLSPDQTYTTVRKMGLDSIPNLRRHVLEHLLLDTATWHSTTDIAIAVEHPANTTRRTLEDLAAHHLVLRSSQGKGKADLWKASDYVASLWLKVGVPEMSTNKGTGFNRDQEDDLLDTYLDISETPLFDGEEAAE